MIGINIQMPESCASCPCSYWVQNGEYEGMLMCQAMESMLPETDGDQTGKCIVDEWAEKRPENCPMTDAVFPKYCPHCGKALFKI